MVKLTKSTDNQRDAPGEAHLVVVVRGPLMRAMDDYVIHPITRRPILETPVEVEISAVILEWLDQGKLEEYVQPQDGAKE